MLLLGLIIGIVCGWFFGSYVERLKRQIPATPTNRTLPCHDCVDCGEDLTRQPRFYTAAYLRPGDSPAAGAGPLCESCYLTRKAEQRDAQP